MFAFMVLMFFVPGNKAQIKQSHTQDIPTLTYAELIKNFEFYLEKSVRVKSNWIYGFEWSFLCDSECKNRKSEIFVDFVDEEDLCKGSKRKLKKGSDDFDNKAEVVFVGTLSSGRFGHFGSSPYQFKVGCIEKFKKLPVKIK